MLFNIFNPRIIPHIGIDKNNPKKDYSSVTSILAPHSEIPRKEYEYKWNSDGIRSIEFSLKPEIVAIGCSITMGQGLPEFARWTNILSDKINIPIGNISYSGAAINKNISSFFGMIHQYNYLPKVLICHFANFERFYFIDGAGEHMRDWYINYKPKKTKAFAPWDYEEILPYEWVYYQNLDHIKMLEAFCDSNGIKLIWTTWSNNLSEDQESFLLKNFKHYYPDITKKEFPPDFEFSVNPNNLNKLKPYYEMKNHGIICCHIEQMVKHPDIFDYAYDYHKIAGEWGPGAHWPHPGIHRQLHIADFYYDILKKIEYIV